LFQGIGFVVKSIAFYDLAIYNLINGIGPNDHGAPIVFVGYMKFCPIGNPISLVLSRFNCDSSISGAGVIYFVI
jgi:hypothetical protein